MLLESFLPFALVIVAVTLTSPGYRAFSVAVLPLAVLELPSNFAKLGLLIDHSTSDSPAGSLRFATRLMLSTV